MQWHVGDFCTFGNTNGNTANTYRQMDEDATGIRAVQGTEGEFILHPVYP